MSLPNVVTPTYTAQLKSIKEPVRFRPYTVKEEKIFLMAKESTEQKDMEDAVRQVLRNCTFDKVNIDQLPSFDIEYLFLQLRGKSVSNVIEIQYQCENVMPESAETGTDKKCHATNTIQIPIDDIRVITPDNHTLIVKITDELTIEFKYPTVETIAELMTHGGISASMSGRVVASCIKTIVESNGTIHESHDHTLDELVDFIETLSLPQIQLCQAFFGTIPYIKYETTYTCSKCAYSELLHFEGLADFFG